MPSGGLSARWVDSTDGPPSPCDDLATAASAKPHPDAAVVAQQHQRTALAPGFPDRPESRQKFGLLVHDDRRAGHPRHASRLDLQRVTRLPVGAEVAIT